MMLGVLFTKENYDAGEQCSRMGVPVKNMTRGQLIAFIGMLNEQLIDLQVKEQAREEKE